MDLFKQYYQKIVKAEAPLADRMLPRTLDKFVGQDHIIGRVDCSALELTVETTSANDAGVI